MTLDKRLSVREMSVCGEKTAARFDSGGSGGKPENLDFDMLPCSEVVSCFGFTFLY